MLATVENGHFQIILEKAMQSWHCKIEMCNNGAYQDTYSTNTIL